MGSSQILSLPGMTDVTGGAHQQSAQVVETLASYFATQGYEPIDTPIVEDADLFVRKAGGELSGMIYTFDDPGGNRVSLRPEFTPSVIRYYIEHSGTSQTQVRWRYGGPVFRYHRLGNGDLRQYTQIGAELIGVTLRPTRRSYELHGADLTRSVSMVIRYASATLVCRHRYSREAAVVRGR